MEILKYCLIVGVLLIPGCYAAFLAAVYIGFARRKKAIIAETRPVSITVVIAARNERENIGPLLQSLHVQSYAPVFDVIVADDHSTDDTIAFYKDFNFNTDKFRLKMFPAQGTGKKAALTEAIASCTSDLILVTDADCFPGKRWVESYAQLFGSTDTEFAAGLVKYIDGDSLLRQTLQTEMIFLQVVSAGTNELGFPSMCNGANMAFTRQFFKEAGGFSDNEYVSGDDILLLHKAAKRDKRRVRWNYDSGAVVETSAAETITEACVQRQRWLSKFNGYKSLPVILLGYLFLAVQLLLPAWICWSLSTKMWMNVLTYAVGMKIGVELLFLSLTAPYFREHKIIPVFPLSVILYEVISLGGALRTFTGEVEWKGRKWKRGKMK